MHMGGVEKIHMVRVTVHVAVEKHRRFLKKAVDSRPPGCFNTIWEEYQCSEVRHVSKNTIYITISLMFRNLRMLAVSFITSPAIRVSFALSKVETRISSLRYFAYSVSREA